LAVAAPLSTTSYRQLDKIQNILGGRVGGGEGVPQGEEDEEEYEDEDEDEGEGEGEGGVTSLQE
jgi:hypothetical protein